MIKLTPEQRYTLYCILLEEAKEIHAERLKERWSYIGGMCDILAIILEEKDSENDILERLGLTEILAQEPIPRDSIFYWFENNSHGWAQRIHLLEKAIKKVSKEIIL